MKNGEGITRIDTDYADGAGAWGMGHGGWGT